MQPNPLNLVAASLEQAHEALSRLRADHDALRQIAEAGQTIAMALRGGSRVYSCGNGGSMSDAMHFAEELSGRFRGSRQPLAAQAISDVGHLSCVANDFGWQFGFARYLEAHGRPGDVLLAISTSGESENVVQAARQAHKREMTVIGLHGSPASRLAMESDVSVATPAMRWADRVQELHIKVIHCLIEVVESELGLASA